MGIVLAKENSNGEIYNVVTFEGGINADNAPGFFENILKCAGKSIVVYITSHGGLISAGSAMLDMISTMSKPVTFISKGRNGSMGALLPHAGDSIRLAYRSSTFIYHAPTFYPTGTEEEVKSEFASALKTADHIRKTAIKSIGLSANQYKKYDSRDVAITAEEALRIGRHGMIDGIILKDYGNGTFLIETTEGNKLIDTTKHRRGDLANITVQE